MNAMIGAGILSGVGSLFGSGFSSGMSYRSVRDTNRTNLQIAKENRDWQKQENLDAYNRDIKMWNLQNLYNSPSSQMSRLRQAGLNPNLVYGSGSVAGNSAGSPPEYEPVQSKMPTMQAYQGWNLGISDAASQFLSYKMAASQLRNQEAQNSLIRAQASHESLKAANTAISTARSDFDLRMANQLKDVSIDRAIAEKNLLESQNAQGWTKANEMVLDYELKRATQQNNIKLSDLQVQHLKESIRRLVQDNDIGAFRNSLEKQFGSSSNSLQGAIIGMVKKIISQFFKF